jgi:anti-anti-sigma factor
MEKNTEALRVEGEMTIYRAAELKQQMQALLDGAAKGPTAIDLSGVTEIDCSGVQLLALAQRVAKAAGRELQLDKPSPAVLEVFELLGLAPQPTPA